MSETVKPHPNAVDAIMNMNQELKQFVEVVHAVEQSIEFMTRDPINPDAELIELRMKTEDFKSILMIFARAEELVSGSVAITVEQMNSMPADGYALNVKATTGRTPRELADENQRLKAECEDHRKARQLLATDLKSLGEGAEVVTALAAGVEERIANIQVDNAQLAERVKVLEAACAEHDRAICQTLGKALRLPRFCDDQANFPGATEADGVCVVESDGRSLAESAAKRIKVLEGQRDRLRSAIDDFLSIVRHSAGVIGWHLNGDVLPWGQCEFVDEMESALAQCTEGQAGGEQQCQ